MYPVARLSAMVFTAIVIVLLRHDRNDKNVRLVSANKSHVSIRLGQMVFERTQWHHEHFGQGSGGRSYICRGL